MSAQDRKAVRYVVRQGAKGWVVEQHQPNESAPYMVGGYFRTKREAEEYTRGRRLGGAR